MTDEPVVAVPADLELEERLVGPVTFRMASWLAASAAGAVILGVGGLSAARLILGAPLVLLGLAGAFWRPGGRAAPSWLIPMTGYLRRRRADRAAVRDHADSSTMTAEPTSPTPARISRLRAESRPFLSGLTHGRTRRPAAVAAALLLLISAFAGGRFARAHQSGPVPASPAQAPAPAVTPAITTEPSPVASASPTPLDPWSDCGC